MQVCYSIQKLREALALHRATGKRIGFVPTMGALHPGHISLLKTAVAENELTVCSIFVNPTQFNDPADLLRYPRMTEKDLSMLEDAGCDLAFLPSVEEMYPAQTENIAYDFGYLEETMEGRHRPGHFKGVAMVVHKFFEIIEPDTAYFGEKDYQQLLIIKTLVKQQRLAVGIRAVATVREADGLAMSSRNMRLNAEDRRKAALIPRTLFAAKEKYGKMNMEDLKRWVREEIKSAGLEAEYFEIANAETLEPTETESMKDEQPRGFIAVKIADVRLIDNIPFYS